MLGYLLPVAAIFLAGCMGYEELPPANIEKEWNGVQPLALDRSKPGCSEFVQAHPPVKVFPVVV